MTKIYLKSEARCGVHLSPGGMRSKAAAHPIVITYEFSFHLPLIENV